MKELLSFLKDTETRKLLDIILTDNHWKVMIHFETILS